MMKYMMVPFRNTHESSFSYRDLLDSGLLGLIAIVKVPCLY